MIKFLHLKRAYSFILFILLLNKENLVYEESIHVDPCRFFTGCDCQT